MKLPSSNFEPAAADFNANEILLADLHRKVKDPSRRKMIGLAESATLGASWFLCYGYAKPSKPPKDGYQFVGGTLLVEGFIHYPGTEKPKEVFLRLVKHVDALMTGVDWQFN